MYRNRGVVMAKVEEINGGVAVVIEGTEDAAVAQEVAERACDAYQHLVQS